MTGLDKNRRRGALRTFLSRFAGDRRANVLIMFGITLPIMLAIVGAGIDFSYAEDTKVQLQDASDAASLAVSAEVVKNPNDSVQTLRTLAQNSLNANYPGAAPTISAFHVCAPVQNDCTNGSTTMAMDTVTVTAQATAPCIPLPIPTTVCTGSPPGQTVNATTTTVIGFGANLQLNVILDSSASMIVGATQSDVDAITTWVSTKTIVNEKCGGSSTKIACYHWGNWNSIKPDDQVADYKVSNGTPSWAGDNPPCAFACHDVGGSTSSADIVTGLNNAHAAGAQTRWDVMISAAQQLVGTVQNLLANNANLARNNYYFNVFSFDDSIHRWGTANMACTSSSCSAPLNAINSVTPGLDTYLNSAMQAFSASSGTNAIGANGNGSSASSPLKFVILVTDGLQSDRNNNWGGTTGFDANWNYSHTSGFTTHYGAFDGPINTAYCTALKNEGVVLAVLETPYVPLTGQSPQVQPYEQTVRHTIYPNGPNTSSAISAALQSCATSGYYFLAANSTDIATGFNSLTTKFIQQHSYISQ